MDEMQTSSTKLSGTVSSNSSLNNGTVSSNSSLAGGNLNTYDKEQDPTVPKYVKSISEEDIEKWDSVEAVAAEVVENTNSIKRIEDNTFEAGDKTGSFLHLEDTVLSEFKEITIEGDYKQKTVAGNQLYNYKDVVSIQSGVTQGEDGWVTITYDNTNGTAVKYINYFVRPIASLKTNTNYKIITEIKNVSGTGKLNVLSNLYANGQITGSQFASSIAYDLAELTSNTIKVTEKTTLDNFTDVATYSTRTFISFAVGQSGSVTFRLSILEDTSVTEDTFVYEPFTNGISPNPQYPQEIKVKNAGDLVTLNSTNKNLTKLKLLKLLTNASGVVEAHNKCYGVLLNTKDINNISIKGTTEAYNLISDKVIRVGLFNEYPIVGTQGLRGSTGVSNTFINTANYDYCLLSFLINNNTDEVLNTIEQSFQIEVNSPVTEYIEPKQELIDILIPEGEFFGKSGENTSDKIRISYNEEDGKYHFYLDKYVGKYIFTGTEKENFSLHSTNDYGINNFAAYITNYLNVNYKNVETNDEIKSNYFVSQKTGIADTKTQGMLLANKTTLYFRVLSSEIATIQNFINWVKENNIEFYYPLAQSYTIDLGSIDSIPTYLDITNLYTVDELDFKLNAQYYRNIKNTINTIETNIKNNTNNINTLNNNVNELYNYIGENNETLNNKIRDNIVNIDRLENNIFESGEATGESITLEDSVLSELKDLEIKAVNRQVTTQGNQLIDFTKPDVIGSGVSVSFDKDVLKASISSGLQKVFSYDITDIFKNNANKKLTFGCTSADFSKYSNNYTTVIQLMITDSSNTNAYVTIYNTSNVASTYTIPADAETYTKVLVRFILSGSIDNGASELKFVKPMLYFDNNSEYEPFTNLLPSPSPSYPQSIPVMEAGEVLKVNSVNQNLVDFNIGKVQAGTTKTFENDVLTIEANGNYTYQYYYQDIQNLIKVNPGKRIRMYFEKIEREKINGSVCQIIIYYNDGTSTLYKPLISKDLISTTYLIPNDTSNISRASLCIYATNTSTAEANKITIIKPMLVFGSLNDSFEYVTHQESKIEATIPENEFFGAITNISDSFKISYNETDGQNHLYLNKNIGRYNCLFSKTSNNGIDTNMYHIVTPTIEDCRSNLGGQNTLSNFFKTFGSTNGKKIRARIPLSLLGLTVETTQAIAREKVIELFGDFTATFYYLLEKPYTIDLGAINQLKTYNNITNIFNNSSLNPSMLVHYYRNFVATIRNLQINNGILKEELANMESRLTSLEASLNSLAQTTSLLEEETK